MNVFSISCYCQQKKPIIVTVISEKYCTEHTNEYLKTRQQNERIKEKMGFETIFIETTNKNTKDLILLVEEKIQHFIKDENNESRGEKADYDIAGIELYGDGDVLTTKFSKELGGGTAFSPLVFHSFIERKSLCDTVIEDDEVTSIEIKKELVDKLLAAKSKKVELPNSQWVFHENANNGFLSDTEALTEKWDYYKESVNNIKNRGDTDNETYFSLLADNYQIAEEPLTQGLEFLYNQLQNKGGFFCEKIIYAGCAYCFRYIEIMCTNRDHWKCAVFPMYAYLIHRASEYVGVTSVVALFRELLYAYYIELEDANNKTQLLKIKVKQNRPHLIASYSNHGSGLLPVEK